MRTIFFREGSPECPLVAITNFEPLEVSSLKQEIKRLANGEADSVILHGDVLLQLKVGKLDLGIIERDAPTLTCVLRRSIWNQVADLLEPFTDPNQHGYQWLDETGEVKLLISTTGEW